MAHARLHVSLTIAKRFVHLVFHGAESCADETRGVFKRHPRAARQNLRKHLQDVEFWNVKICVREAKQDAFEACHCLQCGDPLCHTRLKSHVLSQGAPGEMAAGNRQPAPYSAHRTPEPLICNMKEVGSAKRNQVDVYGLGRGA